MVRSRLTELCWLAAWEKSIPTSRYATSLCSKTVSDLGLLAFVKPSGLRVAGSDRFDYSNRLGNYLKRAGPANRMGLVFGHAEA